MISPLLHRIAFWNCAELSEKLLTGNLTPQEKIYTEALLSEAQDALVGRFRDENNYQ